MEKTVDMNPEKIRIVAELKNRLSSQLNDNLKEVILFGSQLTDKDTRDSDYDVLIVIKRKTDWKLERKISDICYEIDLKYGILTDAHILTESELNLPRGKQPIFDNALNQGYHA
ncbi:MAG: nucleotidyltransferase domain-containing protein [Mangrovibacterium sp.]